MQGESGAKALPSTCVIINPTGGAGKAKKWMLPIELGMRSLFSTRVHLASLVSSSDGRDEGEGSNHVARGTFCMEETHAGGEAVILARTAALLGFEVIVAIGGDGTLSEVVNGIFTSRVTAEGPQSQVPAFNAVAASTLPRLVYGAAGTGGDFSRLGYSCKTPAETLSALQGVGCVRPMDIDVGFVRFVNQNRTKFFINETSVGLGFEVCSRADRLKSSMSCCPGKAVFWCAAFVELLKMSHRYVMIRPLDASGTPIAHSHANSTKGPTKVGSKKEDGPQEHDPLDPGAGNGNGVSEGWFHTHVTAAVFCNGRFFGGGMHVAPGANPQDQTLNLTMWRERFAGFFAGMASVYNGKHVKWKSTTTLEAGMFEVKATSPKDSSKIGFEVDGELGGSLPAVIGIAGSLTFLVPTSSGAHVNVV